MYDIRARPIEALGMTALLRLPATREGATPVKSICAAVFTAYVSIAFAQEPLPATPHAPTPLQAQNDAFLAAQVAQETAELGVKPHTVVLVTDKALSATEALRRGDYQSASSLAQEILAKSKLQAFSFRPFDRFVSHLSLGNDSKFLDGLSAWISHNPKSAMAYLLRASYYKNTAWLVRGSEFDKAVPEEHMRTFKELLGRAGDDVRQSIALDPKIPWSYLLQLQLTGGSGNQHELDRAFGAGIARYPAYYDLYLTRLKFLQPKWGGSVGAMYKFVADHAGKAPPSSPLKMLYLQLSANLLNAAWVSCEPLQNERLTECMNFDMNRNVTEVLTDGMTEALNMYKHTDPVEFSNTLWPILSDMINTPGNSTSTNAVLQLAADAMGSDIQLIHEPGHNNYALDDITARVWSKLGNADNVQQKFMEALGDVERMSFPDEDEKDGSLATIYDDMASAASSRREQVKVIAYHDAANAVAGVNHGGPQYDKCGAYFQLRHLQAAVDECTLLIDTYRGGVRAHLYRAWAYESFKNYDAAIADYGPIADDASESAIRTGAVIDIDHIAALRGQYATELAIFQKYPFVFDTNVQSKENLAIVYNNRCFAYMKTGELKKALDDCTTSLMYGRLPDALQKQQQLQKLLSAGAT
jgi:tetratricopeptide (TPR) repeat protein